MSKIFTLVATVVVAIQWRTKVTKFMQSQSQQKWNIKRNSCIYTKMLK